MHKRDAMNSKLNDDDSIEKRGGEQEFELLKNNLKKYRAKL